MKKRTLYTLGALGIGAIGLWYLSKGARASCIEGDVRYPITCPDESVVYSQECVDGAWTDTGQHCSVSCLEGEVEQTECPDHTFIDSATCVDGSWQSTGNTCPCCEEGTMGSPIICPESLTTLYGTQCRNCSWVLTGVTPADCPYAANWDLRIVGTTIYRADGTKFGGPYTSFTSALQTAVNQTGKIVYLPAGTYTVSSLVYLKTGVTLLGAGNTTTGTVLRSTYKKPTGNFAGGCLVGSNVNNVSVKNLRITGTGNLEFNVGSGTFGGHLVQDVVVADTNSSPGGFITWTNANGILDGVTYERCTAYNVCGVGFKLGGNLAGTTDIRNYHYSRLNKNIHFIDCMAQNCGKTNRWNAYDCGYSVGEGSNCEYIYFDGCKAINNLCNGFHVESHPYTIIYYTDCVSQNNGCWGFMCRNDDIYHQTQFVNCSSSGNVSGQYWPDHACYP